MPVRKLMNFLRRDDGVISTEAVIWMPFYMLILGFISDASMLMSTQTQMWSVASDTSRFVSMGSLTPMQAEDYAKTRNSHGASYSVSVFRTGDVVVTNISLPFRAVAGLGVLTSYSGNLGVSAAYRQEPSA